MKAYDSATLAVLASGRAVERDMMLFDLGSGLYGFHTGIGVFNYSGVDYVGAGQLITLEPASMGMDLSSSPLIARLSSIPNTDLTPNVLATIENEIYHQRPVTVSRAYFDPDTRALLSVERWWRGYIDKIEHEEQIGGGMTLVGYLESKSRDHLKTGYRRRADADQRRVSANDGGLRYTATVGEQEILWGRLPTNPAQSGGAVNAGGAFH